MATSATRIVQREIERQMKMEAKLLKLPRPKFDGFSDTQSSHQSFWGDPGVEVKICSDRDPCCALVTLYAKMGLHRYNLLHRTNFELIGVEKYNYEIPMLTTTYYITFLASDPAHPQTTFQTLIYEHDKSKFALSCYIARRLGDDDDEIKTRSFYISNLPEWPPENPFDQFYLLNESELQQHNDDWVRLYLELAVAISDRSQIHHLTNVVEIVKVAIDTTSMEQDKNATVYIRYKDSCVARVGNDVDRIAVVRRCFDELTGRFTLEGQSWPGITMPEKNQSVQVLPFLSSERRRFFLEKRKKQRAEEKKILEDQKKQSSAADIMMPEKDKILEDQKNQSSSADIMMPEKDKILEDQKNQSSAADIMMPGKDQNQSSSAGIMMPEKDKILSARRLLFRRRLGVLNSGHKACKNPGLHKTRSI